MSALKDPLLQRFGVTADPRELDLQWKGIFNCHPSVCPQLPFWSLHRVLATLQYRSVWGDGFSRVPVLQSIVSSGAYYWSPGFSVVHADLLFFPDNIAPNFSLVSLTPSPSFLTMY